MFGAFGQTRTDTDRGLNPMTLPIGLRRHYVVGVPGFDPGPGTHLMQRVYKALLCTNTHAIILVPLVGIEPTLGSF